MSQLIAAGGRRRGDGNLNRAMVSTPHRQRANELRGAFQKAIEGVRADDNLSSKGKQQLIARAYRNTNQELRRLAKEDWEAQVSHHDALESKLFGTAASTPEAAMSFRDAAARANALADPDAAKVALGSARLSGDTTMAKAIALRSWCAEWHNVVEDFAVHSHPDVGDQIAELTAVRDNLNNLTEKLGGGMTFGDLGRPEELRGAFGSQLDDLADADPQPSRQGLEEMTAALGVAVINGTNGGMMTDSEFRNYAFGVRTELAEAGE